jgi:hypothetical protein
VDERFKRRPFFEQTNTGSIDTPVRDYPETIGKSRSTYNVKPYYSQTKTLIKEAVKVLGGEKSYNTNNLD